MAARLIRQYPLAAFFILAFATSWGACIPFLIAGPAAYPILFIVGASGPAVAALIVTSITTGKPGIRDLLSGILRWRVPLRWWVIALFGPPLVMAAAIGIQTATGSQVRPPRALAPVSHLPAAVFLLSLPLVALFEEIGWRGFAQIRLEKRHGPVRAAAVLGILWACWHLPLFFIPGLSHANMPFVPYLVFAVVLCLWFGWLYRHTRSILIATIFHASINYTGILGGGSPGAEIIFGVLVFLLTLVVPLPWVRRLLAGKSPAGPDT